MAGLITLLEQYQDRQPSTVVTQATHVCQAGTGLKHGADLETNRKTDRDKLQIQGLEQNLHQLCHVASKIIFCCGW